jgi:hypothetical protein
MVDLILHTCSYHTFLFASRCNRIVTLLHSVCVCVCESDGMSCHKEICIQLTNIREMWYHLLPLVATPMLVTDSFPQSLIKIWPGRNTNDN